MMKKGFLTFVLASVFLLAIVASAFRLSQVRQDNSYQKYQLAHLQELAIKSAFYQSTASAAKEAYAAAAAEKLPPKPAVEAAVAANAILFESELSAAAAEQGYEVSFWCGPPWPEDPFSRQRASEKMYNDRHASSPGIAVPVALCETSFSAEVFPEKKIHIRNLGFSSYSESLGFGYATVFPSAYPVGFP